MASTAGIGQFRRLVLTLLLGAVTSAAYGAEGTITRLIKNVSVSNGAGQTRAAMPNERIRAESVLRTAVDSRAEVTLSDRSVLRIGARDVVRFASEGMELASGALLFQAPTGTSVLIKAGAIRVQASGATGIVERLDHAYLKVMLLQGTVRVFLPAKVGESILLNAGQILITKPEAAALPEPVDFSIAQLYRTSVLTNKEFPRLASDSEIVAAIQEQKNNPNLIPTNLVIFGRGTLVTLTNPTAAEKKNAASSAVSRPAASPSPSPIRRR